MDPSDTQNMTQHRLPDIKAVIAVASGKGGVGKSTIAVNLACALSRQGHDVALLDADIYGPSQHIMLGLKDQDPIVGDDKKIHPLKKFGLTIMSFGFFVKADEAVVWRGPMISRMFQQFVDDVEWGAHDYLVVDLPPGTGDIQLTLTQYLQVTGAVIVTTPQDVAVADAIKGVNMFQKVDVDILGIVENMSHFVCPQCGHEAAIFSTEGGRHTADRLKVPFLGDIPLEVATREAGDQGYPIVIRAPESEQAMRFLEISEKLHEAVQEIKKKGPKIQPPSPSHAKSEHFAV